MMEMAGVEPASKAVSNSSRPQAWLIFNPQTNKCIQFYSVIEKTGSF